MVMMGEEHGAWAVSVIVGMGGRESEPGRLG